MGTTQYLWDAAGSLPLLVNDGSTNYIYGPGGLPLEQISASTTLWYHHDQLGSTRLVTNSSGLSQATYTYDPYGGLASGTGSITNPLRYSGQYLDSESGFYYLRARYYDTSTAQFLSKDLMASLTRQPYGYVGGGPINASDPTGLCGWDFWTCNWSAAGHALVDSAKAQDWHPSVENLSKGAGTGAALLSLTALGCALIAAPTVVGEVLCGAAEVGALALGAIATGADITLALEGKKAWGYVLLDVFALSTGGLGFAIRDLAATSDLAWVLRFVLQTEGLNSIIGVFPGSPTSGLPSSQGVC